jgi:hypothetical protein
LGRQLNVDQQYYFRFTVEDLNGWDNIGWDGHMEINGWFDGGDDANGPVEQITGENYKFRLIYADFDNPAVPTPEECEKSYGTLELSSVIITEEVYNQRYTFDWPIKLDKYSKHAKFPGGRSTSFNNNNTWNFGVQVNDGEQTTTMENNGTESFEFGIYKHTSVSIGGNWVIPPTEPGSRAVPIAQVVSFTSNDDFNLSLWFDSTFTSDYFGDSMDIDNVELIDSGPNDDLASDVQVPGLSEIHEITVISNTGYGDHSEHYGSTTGPTNTTIIFQLFVPYGSIPDVYTAGLTVQVTQVE